MPLPLVFLGPVLSGGMGFWLRMHGSVRRYFRVWLTLATVLPLITLSQANAQDELVGVVELFTSQGCSSCPPADAFLAELAGRDDLVALAYHVDYWDYLGWKDELATPENTARQRAYEGALGSSVYTPQIVVDGRYAMVGSDRGAVMAALDKQPALSVDVGLSFTDTSLLIDIAGSEKTSDADAHVVLVNYRPRKMVTIHAGENKGREIDYRNIVTNFQTVGMWHGKPMQIELPRTEIARKGGGCAVLLQTVNAEGQPGPVLGAAKADDISR